ncbi:MAG: NAD(P)H-dependent oxidoreductase [Candidatus Nanoarchaeia archaeon]|nr:NAD(P)H-dependent oxidoreductase [Candidatus Nanoarchaeia archaeon]
MKRGIINPECEGELYSCKNKPIKIIGISCGKRSAYSCAREDPVSLHYLKLALKEAEKNGAVTELIDLRDLTIGACKECYSTCPAQCRFNEKNFKCDCYTYDDDCIFIKDKMIRLEDAYGNISKEEFFKYYNNKSTFWPKDDMKIIYKAMIEADGVIFASSTNYYGRPALMQAMLSRFCALDGGVEELWGDGKNLDNSIKYSKNSKAKYKLRLYGKHCAFINCSKEGDSVTPNLMKACTMMGMKIIPLAVAYRVNWYNDPTHREDTAESKKDKYTLGLAKHIGVSMVKEIKKSPRIYGTYLNTV